MANGRFRNGNLKSEDTWSGYVYRIWCDSGLQKIGYTCNLSRRLSNLRYENRGKKLFIASVLKAKHMGIMEAFWHTLFDDYQVYNEWFDLPDDHEQMFDCCAYALTEVPPEIDATIEDVVDILAELFPTHIGHFDRIEMQHWLNLEEMAAQMQGNK